MSPNHIEIFHALIPFCRSQRHASLVYKTYISILAFGFDGVKSKVKPTTLVIHLRLLEKAGCNIQDLEKCKPKKFLPFQTICFTPVRHWDDIK